jgi:dTDP-4-dehydrorhamnose reductase
MSRDGSIVIIGRQGQLAQELAALDWSRAYRPVFLGRSDIDLFSATAARTYLAALQPRALINAAAYSHVDLAEQETEACWRLNALLPAQLTSIAGSLGIPLLHVSSDYVFDGTSTSPYAETAQAAPLSTYGVSKRAGEAAVLTARTSKLVVRSAWLFGRHGSNFLKRILARATMSPGGALSVVDDQIGSPTPAAALAAILQTLAVDLIEGKDLPPILHVAGKPEASWHDFARQILLTWAEAGQLGDPPALHRISASSYAAAARRPAYSVLDCRLSESLGYVPPDWRLALQSLARSWAVERIAA